jgi:outer membrane protein OmpA-like peptidoglycan-associated protein
VKVLAVGDASTDGDAKSNHELSSKRASSVAQEVAKITGLDKDSIQAVYFGQTKRFDEKVLTPNRIVEVWVTK